MTVTVELPCRLRKAVFHGICSVGAYTYFSGEADVQSASIGRYCSISTGVIIGPGEHPIDRFTTHPLSWGGGRSRFAVKDYAWLADLAQPLTPHERTFVGNDVWLGANAIVTQGCTLGDGCVVAAGAVVTKNVPAYAIVGGVPARTIGKRFDPDLRAKLLASNWWELNLHRCDLDAGMFRDPRAFCEQLARINDADVTTRLNPKKARVPARPWQRWIRFKRL
jgi:acetyltransferase-like isoleucine patch superfamily enzyme